MTIRALVALVVTTGCFVLPLGAVIGDAVLGWPSGGFYVVFAPIVFVFACVGWLITVRRTDNAIGPLCLVFAATFAAYFPVDLLVRAGVTGPVLGVLATLSSVSDAPSFIAVAMILILFPDGRLPGPRWRWTVVVAVAGTAASVVGFGLAAGPLAAFPSVTNPVGIPGFPGAAIGELGYVGLIALLTGAIGALVVRWRRGRLTERAQVKWVGAAAAAFVLTEVFNLATFDPRDPFGTPVAVVVASLGTALVPLAIGIAVLRYRLYEIDRIVSRTIGWGVITGSLLLVFVAAVVALQAALSGVTQGQTLAVAASTLVAYALFQPLRRRVQAAVDRRFDRARYDGELVVGQFTGRLRGQVDLASLCSEVQVAASEAVRPSGAAVWLRHAQVHPAREIS